MKKVIFFIVFMLGCSAVFAQTHNPVTAPDHDVTLSTDVIVPFRIYDATPATTPSLPDVIKGQTRVLPQDFWVKIFEMNKEANYTVRLKLKCPEPIDGVDLDAFWYFNDENPPWNGGFPGVQIANWSAWDWFGAQTHGWASLQVNKITASATAAPGLRTFTAYAEGQYIGL